MSASSSGLRRTAAGGGTAVAEPASITRAEDGAPAPAEPIVIHLDNEPVTEGYIEIVDVKSGHRVITSIEVLSPANKHAGEGQRLFLQKREDMKRAGVNMVEIDLLRGGDRVLMVPPEQIPPSHRTDYQVCVWRASQPGSVLRLQGPAPRTIAGDPDPAAAVRSGCAARHPGRGRSVLPQWRLRRHRLRR